MSALFQPINQVKLTNVAYVRFKTHGKRFEVAAYKNKIMAWRSKTETDINEVLQIPRVFVNVSRGQYASKEDLQECFSTTKEEDVCRVILNKGEVQVSALEREEQNASGLSEVYHLVSERLYDTRTGFAIQVSHVESELNRLKYSMKDSNNPKKEALAATELLLEKCSDILDRYYYKAIATYRDLTKTSTMDALLNDIDAEVNSHTPGLVDFYCPPAGWRLLESVGRGWLNLQLLEQNAIPPMKNKKRMEQRAADEARIANTDARFAHLNANAPVGGGRIFVPTIVEHRPAMAPPSLTKKKATNENTEKTENAICGEDQQEESCAKKTEKVVEEKVVVEKKLPKTTCATCQCEMEGGPAAFREHCREEWHIFNVKRKVKQLAPVDEQTFNKLSDSQRKKFQAVDF